MKKVAQEDFAVEADGEKETQQTQDLVDRRSGGEMAGPVSWRVTGFGEDALSQKKESHPDVAKV